MKSHNHYAFKQDQRLNDITIRTMEENEEEILEELVQYNYLKKISFLSLNR